MSEKLQRKLQSVIIGYNLLQLKNHSLKNENRIKKIQNDKIHKLMKHAYDIPFYRKKFEEVGLTPDDFHCAEDLTKFPLLTKNELRSWVQEEINKNPDKYSNWYKVTTSGSTGTPLAIYVSPIENAVLAANWIRIAMNNGYNPFIDKTLALKDPQLVKARKGKDSIIQKLGFARRECISFTNGGKEILEAINSYKPDFLHIHRSKCIQTLLYAEKNNISIHKPKLVVIIGEGIDNNSMALLIKYFGDVLYSSYGTMETGACTFTMKGTTDYHIITSDTHVINIVDEQSRVSETGKIVITNLFFYGFPIINYDIGDNADITKKGNITFLCNIKGRTNDMLHFRDGFTVDYHAFYLIMERIIDILQFRIVQEDYEHITIMLVMNKELSKLKEYEVEKRILSEITELIPIDNVKYDFKWFDELEPDENGKRRFIISKITV